MSDTAVIEVAAGELQREEKTLVYKSPIAAALLATATAKLESVHDLTVLSIDSPGTYEAYATELQEINQMHKAQEAMRVELKEPFLKGGREIDDKFREPLAKLALASQIVSNVLTGWRRLEDQKAKAEQARLDAIAREARAKAQKEADELAAAGKVEEAQVAAATAAVISAPTAAYNVPKVAGVHGRKTWKAKITDPQALLRHIAEHPECFEWVEVKHAPLDALARTYKQNFNSIPGVVAEEVESTVGR